MYVSPYRQFENDGAATAALQRFDEIPEKEALNSDPARANATVTTYIGKCITEIADMRTNRPFEEWGSV
jgi:hypothetical protein